jgi:hypothetical protein
MSNHRFVVFLAVIVGLGVATGYWLATLPKLESYQLLNVAGLLYTFLAVVVLSEIATSSVRWKKISVETIAPVVLWLHTVFPLSVSLGGVLAVARHSSSWAVPRFAFSFFVYSIIPLSVLNETVVYATPNAGPRSYP